jgi:hypothetical protein
LSATGEEVKILGWMYVEVRTTVEAMGYCAVL